MNIILYIIIFIMGITFGSFYTLAVHRIPKKQDILYTHSYCPNCEHKLGFLDLIPVFSYIFLRGKCRYCGQKIRLRYLILELISGVSFIIVAIFMGLNIYNIELTKVIQFVFFVLYLTFIVLFIAIYKETKKVNKPVVIYGMVVTVMYMVYLYIMVKS